MEQVEAIVIGAGVIGLACARKLSMLGREVVILDKEASIGQHASSRNSEVIHAGIYYQANSLKAIHCVTGNKLLYQYCEAKNIPYKRLGKLIVATDKSQLDKLDELYKSATTNGVELTKLSAAELLQLEPELNAIAGLLSPNTGIVDSHLLLQSLLTDAEQHNSTLVLNSKVTSGKLNKGNITLIVEDLDGNKNEISTRLLINCAGMNSSQVARSIKGINTSLIPQTYFCKGNYFSLKGKSPFSRLIYPMPETGGLGIHSTLDLSGKTRFGPDVEWIDEPNYTIDSSLSSKFITAIAKYWPNIKDRNIEPDYAGIRSKINKSTEDFQFIELGNGFYSFFGIDSPGLTSAISLAELINNTSFVDKKSLNFP